MLHNYTIQNDFMKRSISPEETIWDQLQLILWFLGPFNRTESEVAVGERVVLDVLGVIESFDWYGTNISSIRSDMQYTIAGKQNPFTIAARSPSINKVMSSQVPNLN